ncbi:AarF/ABC1/UbiB kinase family protein [bacterium]|nr:AarF/ABC1/UbiB kinase family protein [bacterium]
MSERSRSILETYNCLVRYKEITAILLRYGYRDLLERLHLGDQQKLKEVFREKNEESSELVSLSGPERLRFLLEELGTTFIKFGQILSTRTDLLPEEYCAELKKLQDHVTPTPDETAKALIAQELGQKVEDIFREFSPQPIACASIAQVYKAKLPTGETVAVKVRHPDIERKIAADLAIMEDLARLLERNISDLAALRPVALVKEFGRNLSNETNLLIEANNLERFNTQNEGKEGLRLVKLYRELTTSKVLVMEFMEGVKISDTEKLRSLDLDLKAVAHSGTRIILEQVFVQGFFHGDPHPGNILVLEDGRICFLDFGLMGKLNRSQRLSLAEMLVAVSRRRDDDLLKGVLALSENGDEIKDQAELGRDLSDFVDKYAYLPLDKLKVNEILNDLLKLLTVHGIVLPPEISTLVKVLAMLEGTGVALDPEFQVLEEIKPFAEKLILEKYDPKRIATDMTHTSAELYRLLRDLPDEARELIKVVKKAELKINFSSAGLKFLMRAFDKDANRLAYALIVSSLLLASSILLLAHVPPVYHEVSLMGLVGLVVSGAMGLWLLIAIARSGHL